MRENGPAAHSPPLTYLLTFGCYGTWLPGDARGWVDRSRGVHRGGYRNPSTALANRARALMHDSPYNFDRRAAQTVLRAIHEVCVEREWQLLAAHVRSTHVHCVVAGVTSPNRTVADFKAYASRALNLVEGRRTRWAREGSTRRLPTAGAVETAIRYVICGQGEPMAVYCSDRITNAGAKDAPVSPP
jgi:REP element-mobilizing transposase RayT